MSESELSSDGYEHTFSPPSPFVHRMWAGSTLQFQENNPLCVGQTAKSEFNISKIDLKRFTFLTFFSTIIYF